MPKATLDAKSDAISKAGPETSQASRLETGLVPGTAGRRVRSLSCEIGFAVALTVAAVASLLAAMGHEASQTASVADSAKAIPAAQVPLKTQ